MLRLFSSFDPEQIQAVNEAASNESAPDYTIRNVCVATSNKNRNGWTTICGGISLANFSRNPVLLWDHNSSLPENVLGQAQNVRLENDRLVADFAFDSKNERAVTVYEKLKALVIRAFSIGISPTKVSWDQDDDPIFEQSELLEISVTAIGADPNALNVASITSFKAEAKAAEKVEATLAENTKLQSALLEAQAKISSYEAQALANAVDRILDAATGKATPAMKQLLREAGLKDQSWLARFVEALPQIEALQASSPTAKVQGAKTWNEMTTAEKASLYHQDRKAFYELKNAQK